MADFGQGFPFDQTPSAAAQAEAMIRARLGRRDLGNVLQFSGDRVLAPAGRGLLDQAAAGLAQDAERQQAEGANAIRLYLASQAARTRAAERAYEGQRAEERAQETARHNRAMEARPPSFPVIVGGEGLQYRVDPRNPSAPAVPVVDPSGAPITAPKSRANSPRLTDQSKKGLAEAADTFESVDRLSRTFRPEYAGGGLIGETKTAASKALGSWASQGAQDAAAFWADWDKLVNLPERNAVFGASLSAHEKASWEGARNVKPGADPALVMRKLKEIREIARRRGAALARSATSEGYDAEAVKELTRGNFGEGDGSAATPAAEVPDVPRRRRYNPATGALE